MAGDTAGVSERLAQLTLAEKKPFKTETKEYVLHISSQQCSQCGGSPKIAATSSDNTVQLYSRENLTHISSVGSHEKSVTGLRFDRKDPNLLFTSSLDGTLRCWDIREKPNKATSVFEGYDETPIFTCFDQTSNGSILCAGTEQKDEEVHILFWDVRDTERLGIYSDCHQNDITQVCFHPSKPDSLVTGSNDGLVCLFDISESSEDDALLATYNTESAVSTAGFCGSRYCNVYGVPHDRSMHIWDTDEFDNVAKFEDINDHFPTKTCTDYLVDCFQNDADDIFVFGGSSRGDINVYLVDGEQLVVQRSPNGKHSGVIRCFHWENETRTLVTGGEDGMLCLWKPGQNDQSEASDHKSRSSLKSKSKKKDHHHRPY